MQDGEDLYTYWEFVTYQAGWPAYLSEDGMILGTTTTESSGNCNLGPKMTGILPFNYGSPGRALPIIITGHGFTSNMTVEMTTSNSGISFSNPPVLNAGHLATTITLDSNLSQSTVNIRLRDVNGTTGNSKPFDIRVPKHMVVSSDDVGTPTTDEPKLLCYAHNKLMPLTRHLAIRVVDTNWNPVGATMVREVYGNGTINNTCGNGNHQPTACEITSGDTLNGVELDLISVGCNINGGSCGYNIQYDWQWCPSGRTPLSLVTFTEVVHHNFISVNNSAQPYEPGYQF